MQPSIFSLEQGFYQFTQKPELGRTNLRKLLIHDSLNPANQPQQEPHTHTPKKQKNAMNQSQTKRKHQQELINEIKKNTQKKDVRETESKNPTWGVVDETEIDRYIEFFPFSEQGVGFRGKNGKKLIEFSLVATNWIGLDWYQFGLRRSWEMRRIKREKTSPTLF